MATPNYNYEKRQRELAKKKKKEDKLKERESRKVEGDVSSHAEAAHHAPEAAQEIDTPTSNTPSQP